MARIKRRLLPSQQAPLSDLGERLRRARIRRQMSLDLMASRAGFSVKTLSRIEQGDPSVAMRSFVKVLGVLGLERDLDPVARDCDLIRRLYESPPLPRPTPRLK